MLRDWLRRKRPTRSRRIAPHAEWLEPRLLYSADAGALIAATHPDEEAPETRTLDVTGEYAAQSTASPTTAEVQAAYALVPMQFEANEGQLAEGVDFAAFGSGYRIALDAGGAEIALGTSGDAVRLSLVGGGPGEAVAEDLRVTRTNYLVGQDPADWVTDIANYGSVLYRGVYEGIDVRYYGNQGQLEYDFIVAAGADATQLVLRFEGVDHMEITGAGDLLLRVAGTDRELRFAAPFSYQQGANGRETVASHYELQADGTVRITVAAYDTTRQLVVDPILQYGTYFGDSGSDLPQAITVGANGSVYITGYTNSGSGDLSTRLGANAGGVDLFVARFNSTLGTLEYSTRIGGSLDDRGSAITVDAAGNVYVAGTSTSGNFPLQADAGYVTHKAVVEGSTDVVLFKLNSAGNDLLFSTYVGGTGNNDAAAGIALDADGNIYVSGTIAVGADEDAVVYIFDATGQRTATRQIGGSGSDTGGGVAVDADKNVYLVGQLRSDVSMTGVAGHNTSNRHGPDGFLVRYNASGTATWFSYITSSNGDTGTAVAVDGSGKAYVVGRTNAPSNGGFELTSGALTTTRYSNNASYLRIYDTNASGAASLNYSSLVGGSGTADNVTGIALIAGTRAVIVGTTDSGDLPTTVDAVRRTNSSTSGFALVVDTALTGSAQLAYGTYFATGATMGGVAVTGNAFYMAGSTTQTSLFSAPVTGRDFTHAGNEEGFVAAISGFNYNSAPILTGTNSLPSIAEDSAAGSGALVSGLASISDADMGAQPGIAITVANSGNGTWQYALDGTSWTTFTTPASGSALLLAGDSTTRLRFVPAADFNGTSSITFHAWDRTTGTAGAVVSLGTTGGNSAFSTATGSSSVTVTPVNDLPTATAASASGTEDAASIAITLTGSDREDTAISGVKLLALPANGVLYTDAGLQFAAAANTVYTGANVTLYFVPAAHYNGTASFTFAAVDSANGASAAATATIAVAPVNDAPVLAGANDLAAQFEEAAPASGTLVSDLVAGQVSDADAGALRGIAVTAVDSANGGWQFSLDGTNWTNLVRPAAGSALLLAADGVTRVRFLPNPDYAGTGSTITFHAWDLSAGSAGTVMVLPATGGTGAFSVATASASAIVTGINDAPSFTGWMPFSASVTEGATASLGLAGLAYAPGGGSDEASQAFSGRITGLPAGYGTVQLADGTPVVLGNTYTLAELQVMRVVGAANVSGFGIFSFTVFDSGGTANGGVDAVASQSMLVRVTNSAPVLTGSTPFTQLEDVAGNGTLVSDILAGGATDAGAVAGLAVTALPNANSNNGVWQYSLDAGGTWQNMAVSNNASLLLGGTARVRFLSDAGENVNGAVAGFTFRAWDGSTGVSGGTVNIGPGGTGGSSAFSSATTTAQLTITPVNDIPVRWNFTTSQPAPAPATVTVNEGGTTPSSLGLTTIDYMPGYSLEEYNNQVLSYTVSGLPTALGTVYLQDNVTVVTTGTSYTLAQIQNTRFRPAVGVQSGTGTFTWSVKDNAGTANGGVDTLLDSVTIVVRNVAPVLSGANTIPPILEDTPGNGIRVDDLVNGRIVDPNNRYGIAVTAAPSTAGGNWEYTGDGGSTWTSLATASTTSAVLLSSGGQWRIRFNPAADWSGTPTGLTFHAWDRSTGTAGGTANLSVAGSTGGTTAFSTATATATVSVGAVNDAPVRLDAPGVTLNPLIVLDGTPITSLGLAGVTFGPGGGAQESTQSIVSYTITSLPSALGSTHLSDGTTVVTVGTAYSLADIEGMKFTSSGIGALGTGNFSFAVKDNGGVLNGGIDTAIFTVKVIVNRAPILDGANSVITVFEDADWTGSTQGNPPPWATPAQRAGGLVRDIVANQIRDGVETFRGMAITGLSGSGTWQFTINGGSTWTTITGVSNSAALQLEANDDTRVRFLGSTDWNSNIGTAGITFRAWDGTVGTAGTLGDASYNGGPFAYSAVEKTSVVTVTPRNDAPVASGLTGGTVEEGAAAVRMLAGGVIAPGPATATDEALQVLTFRFSTISPNVQVLLADGTTPVTVGTAYTLADFQGMVFRSATGATPGQHVVTFSVQDSGGVVNGVDTSTHSLTLTITNRAPLLVTANPMASIAEETPGNGQLVSDLLTGQVTDPTGTRGIAVTAIDNSNGTWQYTLDGGTTWTGFGTPDAASARLLLANALTRVRFVPMTDWNGTATLTFAAWDGTSGTAGGVADARVGGFASAFSTNTATTSITVTAVNDPPVGGSVANLTVAEDSGSSSLNLGSVSYGAGGGAFENGQVLTYHVTQLPPASLGYLTLADGTAVTLRDYTLTELRGMRFVTAADATGSADFKFEVRDGGGGTDTLLQTLNITVTPVNDAPVAVTETVTATEDTVLVLLPGMLTGNDADLENDALALVGVTQGTNGTVQVVNGNVVFTPTANFTGAATFGYTVSDGLATGSVSVNVTVLPVNDAPVAVDNSGITVTSGIPLTIPAASLLGNDTDVDGDTLTILSVQGATNGSVALSGGDVVFSADLLYTGPAQFTYTVRDPAGATSTATVRLDVVLGVPPVAGADSVAATEDTTKTILASTLLANDSDPDAILGDNLSITSVSAVRGGTVSLSGTTITFTPTANFNGPAEFTYVVDDGNGGRTTGTVIVNVAAANDAPVATDDVVAASEDQVLTLDPSRLLGNDSDIDGTDTLAIQAVGNASHGTVGLVDGNVVYTPPLNFNGTATFTYTVSDGNGGTGTGTVTVIVAAVNDAPLAVDDTLTIAEDLPQAFAPAVLLANDSDIDGNTLAIDSYTQGAKVAVSLNANGDFVFTPATDFNGTDTFTYTVRDGNGGTGTATVRITVTPMNDAPVARTDAFTILEDSSLTLTPAMLLGNDGDLDGDALTLDVVNTSAQGTIAPSGSSFVFTPNADFAGTTTLTYRVSDGNGGTAIGTITLAVTNVNDAPVLGAESLTAIEDTPLVIPAAGLLANDTDADGDTLTIVALANGANGAVTFSGTDVVYTAHANYFGADTFSYTVEDGNGGRTTRAVNVTVDPRNDAPVARGDLLVATEDTPLVIAGSTLTANDFDQESDALTVTQVFNAVGGTASLANGSIVFTPGAEYSGTASFVYRVQDPSGATSAATVTIDVRAANDAPVAVTESFSTVEDTPLTISDLSQLLGNDSDADGDTLRIVSVADGAGGSVNLTPAGVVFTPDADFNGTASFSYTVTDGNGGTASVLVTVSVSAVNDGPTVVADAFDINEDTALIVDPATLLLNDTDPENDAITFGGVSNAVGGTVAIVNGIIVFTPFANSTATASFGYTVTDVHGVAKTGPVTINVQPQADPPVALGGAAAVDEGQSISGTLPAMDPDVGDTLTFTLASGATHGSVAVNSDGTYTYTHGGSENFSDVFTYKVTDAAGAASQASVVVAVNPRNDNTPVAVAAAASVAEGQVVNGNVTASDMDTGDVLTYTVVAGPTHGTVVMAADGSYTYTHDHSENFSDVFTFRVTDANGAWSEAAVTVAIAKVNDNTPVALAGTANVGEGQAVNGWVTATDVDAGDTLTYALVSAATYGNVTVAANGSYTYTHDGSENFADAFTFRATDANGAWSEATIAVTIAKVNDNAPVAQAGTASVSEGQAVNGTVTATDLDAGDALAYTLVGGPTHGSVTIATNGSYTYTHNGSENFADAFAFRATDANGAWSEATIAVTIAKVNDNTPVAQAGTANVAEGQAVTGNVTATDGDTGDTLAYSLASGPAHGTVAVNPNGSYSYTHDGSENFADAFTFKVTDANGASSTAVVSVTVAKVNDNAPVAQAGTASVNEGQAVTGTLTATDADLGDTLTYTLVSGPSTGAVTVNANGGFTYTHNDGENFSDVFTFKVTDANGVSSQSTVTVTVTPVNDNTPAAQAGTVNVAEGQAVTGMVTATDADTGDTLTCTLASGPAHGTVTIAANGGYTYTHDGSENFADAFTFRVTDANGASSTAVVSVTIAKVNDNAPVAQAGTASVNEGQAVTGTLAATDADLGDTLTYALLSGPLHGSVTVNANGSYTYTHNGTENFADVFTFKVMDANGAWSQATVTVTVAPLNDNAPMARAGTASVSEGQGVTGTVTATDADAGDILVYTLVSGPANGTVVINANGSYTYTHDGSENFADAFTFRVTDANGAWSEAVVTASIAKVNDNAPVARAGTASVSEGRAVNGSVTATDADTGDTLAYTLVSAPVHGTARMAANGSYTYTHGGSENFADAFTFRVTDANGAWSEADVSVAIAQVNDNTPVAQAGTASVNEGQAVGGILAAIDADIGDTLTYTLVTAPTNGTVVIGANGSYTYTHDDSEIFADAFTFRVTDANGARSEAVVSVVVAKVNDNAPVAQAGTANVSEGQAVGGTLTATDADTGDTLTYTLAGGPVNGSVVINANGGYTYSHDGSENFADAFTFRVTDANGAWGEATIAVTIAKVNDNAPVAQAGTANVNEGQAVGGTLTATDADAGDTLAYTIVSGPANGTVVIGANGSYTYTHDGSENFADAFIFRVTDANGAWSEASIAVAIAKVNDNAPVAQAGTAGVNEGQVVNGAVVATDADTGDSLAYTLVSGPAYGTVVINASGSYTYTHNGSENFADAFVFRVTDANGASSEATVAVSIAAVNDSVPQAHAGTASVSEGQAVNGLVTATDADTGDTLAYTLVNGPVNGTVTLGANGSYTYTHDGSENFADAFTFRATDANGAWGEAVVSVAIARVNDNAPVAQAATASVHEGQAVNGTLTATDLDAGDTLTYSLVSAPSNGAVTLGGNGSYTYTHDGSENFADAFTFRATDANGAWSEATVAVTVAPVNENAPLARPGSAAVAEGRAVTGTVVATDADSGDTLTFALSGGPAHGIVTLDANGSYTYTHDGSENFADAFIFRVTDANGAWSQATVSVTIAAVNDNAPVAQAGTASVSEGQGGTGNVTGTDADTPETLTYTLVSGPAHGAVTFAADGSYTYMHDGSENFADAFRFQVTDTHGASSQATMSITIARVNDNAPIAQPGTATVNEGQSLAGTLAASDGDTGDVLTYQLVSGPAHGSVVVNANGTYTYTHDGSETASDVFTFQVTDAAGTSSIASVSLAVTPQEDAGTAMADFAEVDEDKVAAGNVLANDRDDDSPLRVTSFEVGGATYTAGTSVQLAGVGTLVLAADGAYVFTPAANWFGNVPLVSYALDGSAASTLQIRVKAVQGVTVDPLPTAPPPQPAPPLLVVSVEPAQLPPAPVPAVPAPERAPAAAQSAVGDALVESPFVAMMLNAIAGFAPDHVEQVRQGGGDPGMMLVAMRQDRDVGFAMTGMGDFVVKGFAGIDASVTRITVEQFQQAMRTGAFIEELNRLRRELRDDFDLDRSTSITVAGLSLGVSVAYVLWLVRGGVLLGSYLSALPAWRLLDPLPVLGQAAMAAGEGDDDDDTFDHDDDTKGPDPLRGFA